MKESPYAVCIGGSAGGVQPLLEIAAAMPPRFPAVVFVVQHIGAHRSMLPELLRARGANHAMHPEGGEKPIPGTIYVAPPDHHMLLEDGKIRIVRGPKENHARPAIDPTFRSVALTYRDKAIGIILSGALDDGTAGLAALKQCGGTAIVQDPDEADEPSMPSSALRNVNVDLRLRVAEIVPAVLEHIRTDPDPPPAAPPEFIVREDAMAKGSSGVAQLNELAIRSELTCPDCGGVLWQLHDHPPLRFRCHTGHAFSALSLSEGQRDTAEQALWSSARSLRELELLLQRVAADSRARGEEVQARASEAEAARVRARVEEVIRLIEQPYRGA